MGKSIVCLVAPVAFCCLAGAQVEVNGDFELGTPFGWTEWNAPWGPNYRADFAATESPFEGRHCLHLSTSSSSFGVYQEFCVEPQIAFVLSWAWRGHAGGMNGWWEVLMIDGPFTYEAADDPANHPETSIVAKWELGFGGTYPPPEEEWTEEDAEIIPLASVVTVVLKCGTTQGPVEGFFDKVSVQHESQLLEISSIEPHTGKLEGGEEVLLLGRNLTADTAVEIGGKPLAEQIRLSTCEIRGTTPAGSEGFAEVKATAGQRVFSLPEGFRYVGPPSVDSIDPAQGPVEGGTPVLITGSNFETRKGQTISVTIGGKLLRDMEIHDASRITGTTPPGTEGPADLRVVTAFGEAVLPGGFAYVAPSAPKFRRGDCNADGAVNIADAVSLLALLFSDGTGPECVEACNANDDDALNIADAVFVLMHLFSGTGPLPDPSPDCGDDPTPSLSCSQDQPDCAAR